MNVTESSSLASKIAAVSAKRMSGSYRPELQGIMKHFLHVPEDFGVSIP